MNPNDAPQEHPVHPAGSPSREHAAEAGVDVTDTVVWTRHGMGTSEWWSHGPFTVRKDRQWLLRRNGELLSQHEYLQGALAEAELCSHARAEAARQDVEEEATAPQAVPLPVAPEPFAWAMCDKHGDLVYVGITYERSDDLRLDCDLRFPANAPHQQIPLYAHPAGQIAEAPTVSGPASSSLPTVSHEVWAERVACSRVAEEFMREHPPGDHWYSANVISARILGRTSGHRILPPALCERLPEASGSDVKEPATASPAVQAVPIQTQDSGHQSERLIPDAHRDGEASS